jgi:subtilisin family serine protease
MLCRVCFAALILAGPASPALADTYVLTASSWGSKQAEAVINAGGFVRFSHSAAGIAIVDSSSATFLADVVKDGAIQTADRDLVVQWVKPSPVIEVDANVASIGDNETYWNAQWAPRAVHAPEAWNAGCKGTGVRVALVDGGIYRLHADLAGRIDESASVSFVPGKSWFEDSDPTNFWHATHVAGIIAADDNSFGVIGIAPEATLIGVKALDNGSGSFGQVIAGILYAATPQADGGGGADIINLSLGAVFAKNDPDAHGLVAAMNRTVNYADRFGVLVVSAAGNEVLNLDHSGNLVAVPAQSGTGIAVAATGPTGFGLDPDAPLADFSTRASYTNFGKSAILLAAPGGDNLLLGTAAGNQLCALPRVPSGLVVSVCWAFDLVISTIRGSSTPPNFSFGFADGTSMAAPAVSAVAAIIKARNPGMSLGDLKNSLARATDDLGKNGRDQNYARGFVNAYKACTQ